MSPAKKFLIANWKMELGVQESVALADELVHELSTKLELLHSSILVVCPSFTALAEVGEHLHNSGIFLGAQDAFWENRGAYTGQVSPADLKEINCTYCLVGHSEQRRLGETDSEISRKIGVLRQNNIVPVFCVGETEQDHKAGLRDEIVSGQLRRVISTAGVGPLIVAYEPVWAIGSGQPTTPHDAAEVAHLIRNTIHELLGETFDGQEMLVLYGGSVGPSNALEFLQTDGINGLLVGSASLSVSSLIELLRLYSAGQ